ncbi:putative DNA-binding transcriptional regulator YafY [Clostridium saccharoperbutylacetonicum]|uniref:Putative transcriptional regulator n=1 Tax=Clostridium saccharoperbutylacetonicum N1-4(HMT) TaxID=931276 RepID=M1LZ46_9CLOT|nr:WYL domain-containing protein [Clostridium saccharoperbutylacetonicum]AGF58570.1 putative transcriptional regulator [Clostridium saccharoperbutylacetonicum N1-4(HMT)]NRT60652.1 putative DNA-binding transcriptional regulator YafY [Clostridium saccharoperbutylacetonicum]NSB23966.1 putative DNA-binding transcriptional regulator YafY [Clostridium saccharoperbutylacetonicum]NSB43342.1 putative DNA-binding transcriptional regulator YafY [Clostridium saccharoperbutylacetonicum]
MGNLNNTLKMLFILKSGGTIKAKDIASRLEVDEKQVRRYKENLDEFFDIESISGKNGGYKLNAAYFPFKEVLTEEEVILLKEAISSLDANYIENNPKLIKAIEKINYTIFNSEDEEDSCEQIIPYSRVNRMDRDLKKVSEDIYKNILDNQELIIEYKDNKGESTERRVQPYQFITYKGEKYLVAFCLLRDEIRFFKLRRIMDYKITSEKFQKVVDVKKLLEDYKKNSIGIFGGEKYNLKLEIKYPMANTIKERIWVENQEIDDTVFQDKIIFKATMTGGPEIISWILSMGTCVKVIEPEELKQDIHKKLKEMIKNI